LNNEGRVHPQNEYLKYFLISKIVNIRKYHVSESLTGSLFQGFSVSLYTANRFSIEGEVHIIYFKKGSYNE